MYLTLSKTTKFLLFQIQSLGRRQLKFDENGRKFSKQVENTVRKGEIACYEQFILFPLCFKKACTADTLKTRLVWERVNNISKQKQHYKK